MTSPAELANQVRRAIPIYSGPQSGSELAKKQDALAALSVLEARLEQAEKALEEIERYAYDAILDGHPSIPEMTNVQNKAMRALARGVVGETSGTKDTA